MDLWVPGQGTILPQSVAVHPEAPKYGRFHSVHVAIGWKSLLDGRVDNVWYAMPTHVELAT